jgi:hypothetical protein
VYPFGERDYQKRNVRHKHLGVPLYKKKISNQRDPNKEDMVRVRNAMREHLPEKSCA